MLQAKIVKKENIIVENIDIPLPKENEVLFKVKYAGICGSDRLMMKDPSFFSYPVVNGHELVGTVASEGKKFKKGIRATILPMIYCRQCEFCKENLFNLCEKLSFIGGTPANGGFAEYITVEEDNIFPLPNSISDEAAAMIEPASVAYHGVNLAVPSKIKKIMIIGTGIIGILAIRILKNRYKINDITAIDLSDKKLEMAAKSGANTTINLKGKNWKTVGELTKNPAGSYDAIVDYVSSSQSMDISLANLKKNGRLIITGLPHDDVLIGKLPFFSIAAKELIIKGCYCYIMQDFHDVIEMLANRIIIIEDLVAAKYDLKDVAKAFADWEKNYSEWFKVLIKP